MSDIHAVLQALGEARTQLEGVQTMLSQDSPHAAAIIHEAVRLVKMEQKYLRRKHRAEVQATVQEVPV